MSLKKALAPGADVRGLVILNFMFQFHQEKYIGPVTWNKVCVMGDVSRFFFIIIGKRGKIQWIVFKNVFTYN